MKKIKQVNFRLTELLFKQFQRNRKKREMGTDVSYFEYLIKKDSNDIKIKHSKEIDTLIKLSQIGMNVDSLKSDIDNPKKDFFLEEQFRIITEILKKILSLQFEPNNTNKKTDPLNARKLGHGTAELIIDSIKRGYLDE